MKTQEIEKPVSKLHVRVGKDAVGDIQARRTGVLQEAC